MATSLEDLISILLNKNNDYGDRSDAASYLEEYDEDIAETALIFVCSDATEDHSLLEDCGESLGAIWSRKSKFNIFSYKSLTIVSRQFVDAVICRRNPHLDGAVKKSKKDSAS